MFFCVVFFVLLLEGFDWDDDGGFFEVSCEV